MGYSKVDEVGKPLFSCSVLDFVRSNPAENANETASVGTGASVRELNVDFAGSLLISILQTDLRAHPETFCKNHEIVVRLTFFFAPSAYCILYPGRVSMDARRGFLDSKGVAVRP